MEKTPEEACREFLGDMGTSVHLMQQNFDTTIITTLPRADLIDYLLDVIVELRKGIDAKGNAENTDIVHVESETLPTGDVRIAAVLSLEISPQ